MEGEKKKAEDLKSRLFEQGPHASVTRMLLQQPHDSESFLAGEEPGVEQLLVFRHPSMHVCIHPL